MNQPHTSLVDPRPNYFAERSYLKTDIPRGTIHTRNGARMCVLTSDFLLGLHRAITHECGIAAEEVLKKCGKKWGQQTAKRFAQQMQEYYGIPLSEFPRSTFEACLIESFSHHGWGKLELDWTQHGQGLIIAVVEHAIYADILPPTERPADPMLAGLLGGFFSELSGEPLVGIQTSYPTQDAAYSHFIVGRGTRLQKVDALLKQGRKHEVIVEELAKIRDLP